MSDGQKTARNNNFLRRFLWTLILVISAMYLFNLGKLSLEGPPVELSYGEFYRILLDNPHKKEVRSAVKTENIVSGFLTSGKKYIVHVPDNDPELIKILRENVNEFVIKPPRTFFINLLYSLGPVLLFIFFLWYFGYRNAQAGGSRIWSFGKSRARLITADQKRTTFNDVAGVDEAKEELKEIIEFLKDPKRFQRLGGKIPKGVLLIGPPGTGKTLLAKAVSGEAGVPFFSISGSDFVELFVGVGASRVRDLFDQAKRYAKQSGKGCIVFIDEIDAVGRQRFAGIGGGHDEREQTLNALLVEMDGFNTEQGIIVIAATNRPDVLDPALLRPGRFDRVIVIDRPDIKGREEILKVHTQNIKIASDVNLKNIARQTPGFSGADLANLVNEAALLAARKNKEAVDMADLNEAIERVVAGPEKKSRVISKDEKLRIAYHEAGHALISFFIAGPTRPLKVTILPRGISLGHTMDFPLEDKYLHTKKELLRQITIFLGGRASEELIFEDISTGAENDLKQATEIARIMVTKLGMSERLGHITFGRDQQQIFLGRDIFEEKNYSDATALLIDQEVGNIINTCYNRAKEELHKNKDKLKILAEALLEKEVLEKEEVERLLGIEDNQKDEGKTA
ncbi:MAG: ATP-dependent zinc metalloprotease FtsH [Candidatus Omnitrophica bacterium]|nr:ATP-dependent zinc metalloprotease FtsH [Candidatus Omnitrophota bacterium]MCM8783547.1 ATP-dependent zinc metalloprotease FtsH [Candidatus Omnitrophota bacterium]